MFCSCNTSCISQTMHSSYLTHYIKDDIYIWHKCLACCHLAFSAKVSFSWCILISRLLLSVVSHSHLLNSFLSLGKHKFYFHIIFIIIKTHLFSSSQKQCLRGILRSPGLQKLRRMFSICLKEYVFLSILLVLPASFSASVLLETHSCLFCFGVNLYFIEAPNSWLVSDPAVQPLQPVACLPTLRGSETASCTFPDSAWTLAENSLP